MAKKSTKKQKRVYYLIKAAFSKTYLDKPSSPFTLPYRYFGENYRKVESGVPISCYESRADAVSAIRREKTLLAKERKAFHEAVKAVQRLKLPKGYECAQDAAISLIDKRTNPWAKGKPVYKIVKVDAALWDDFCH